ncbi:MAG: selenide, water dikinase SelD [Microthrixaceae bacterium]
MDTRSEPGAPGGATDTVRLTDHAPGAGCGCKLSASELAAVFAAVSHEAPTDARLIVGPERSDDAGVFDLGDGRTMVQSVDVFTPVVDDAFDWGRIAAANALSDIYAMGARPVTALQILCWPRALGYHVAARVLDGAGEVLADAGVCLLGGHSIDDSTPKFGLSVTGLGDGAPLTNAAAVPGDALVLTKALGTGVVTTANAAGSLDAATLATAVESMVRLNSDAATVAISHGAHAATDVTGFGLVGHLLEMCRASAVVAAVDTGSLPALPSVPELISAGHLSGGTRRNRQDAFAGGLAVEDPDAVGTWLACDAQTSGGLLVAAEPDAAEAIVGELRALGHPASVIGEIAAPSESAPVVQLTDRSAGRPG